MSDLEIKYLELYEKRAGVHAERNATKEEFINLFGIETWKHLLHLVKIASLLGLYKQILAEIADSVKKGDAWEACFITAMNKTSIIYHCHTAYPELTECTMGDNLTTRVQDVLTEVELELSGILANENLRTLYHQYTELSLQLTTMKIQMNKGKFLSDGIPHFF